MITTLPSLFRVFSTTSPPWLRSPSCPSSASGIPTVLQEDVEKDDADFVVSADVRVQQNGDDGSHGVLDLLPFSIGAHGQVLQKHSTLAPFLATVWIGGNY